MRRAPILALAAAAIAATTLIGAAQPPVLAKVSGGLWELEGVPGSKAPARECIADVAMLAQYEHRGKACTRSMVDERGDETVIQYSCGGAGFGRTEVELITPRSLRIDTQGISGGAPFRYVIQAHRLGDCPKPAPPPRH
jgi:hypothetical protein